MAGRFCLSCGLGWAEYYNRVIPCPSCNSSPDPSVALLGETYCFSCGTKKREISKDYWCKEAWFPATIADLAEKYEATKKNPANLVFCPSCGKEVASHAEITNPVDSPEESKLKKAYWAFRDWYRWGPGENVTIWVGATVVVLLGYFWLSGVNQQGSDGIISNSDEAVALCQVVVKDSLKDSGSASFSNATASPSGEGWTSTGLVTAKNSFGAFDTRVYACTMSQTNVTSVSVR
jgi:hypothetical protein